MSRVKVRRVFPRNRFYVGLLLDWKESVDDRNFRSVLCRALINLKAYPLNIATFTDLKNIRGNSLILLYEGYVLFDYCAWWEMAGNHRHNFSGNNT